MVAAAVDSHGQTSLCEIYDECVASEAYDKKWIHVADEYTRPKVDTD